MLLQKTEKARSELMPGVRTLGLRERSLLLLADGRKSIHDFGPMFDGEGEQIVLGLLRDGYLHSVRAGREAPAAAAPVTPSRPAAAQAAPAPQLKAPAPDAAPVANVAADQFEGRRSLATTRMFLFDLCERMFARRDPALAERCREALRQAKDRESMLAAGREMIAEIEKAAGHERADSISERIAMLLPAEKSGSDSNY